VISRFSRCGRFAFCAQIAMGVVKNAEARITTRTCRRTRMLSPFCQNFARSVYVGGQENCESSSGVDVHYVRRRFSLSCAFWPRPAANPFYSTMSKIGFRSNWLYLELQTRKRSVGYLQFGQDHPNSSSHRTNSIKGLKRDHLEIRPGRAMF
jgi:hypothetical protein